MSAPPRERERGSAYAPPGAPPAPPGDVPNGTPDAGVEPTEVRLVGVDAQVVSPAWELELIVTGIVLVGLFQIPPWLDGLWRHWEPHVSLLGGLGARTLVVLVNAALYILIICFVVALALRGYWVALVGVNSVFPHGVQWDKQREYGPIQAELARERVRALPNFIGRANDAATMVYASGFALAAASVSGLALVAVAVAVFAALSLFLPVKAALAALGVITIGMALAVSGAGLLDMRFGATLVPGTRRERALRGVLRVVGALSPAGVRSLTAVLTSNVSKRVAYAASVVAFAAAFLSARATMAHDDALPGASNYTYFAEDRRPGVVSADLYESLRGADAATDRLPSVQSDIVTDPYVRLFVPYRPLVHDAALRASARRSAPSVRPTPRARRRPTTRCWRARPGCTRSRSTGAPSRTRASTSSPTRAPSAAAS